jgi:signal peptidase I
MRPGVRYCLAGVIFVGCVRTAIVSPVKVLSGSMVPTVSGGDYVLVNRLTYGLNVPWLQFDRGFSLSAISAFELFLWSSPSRGDVILFENPERHGTDYIKRVVGRPGDTIELVSGRLYVNGIEQKRGKEIALSWQDDSCHTVSGIMQSEGSRNNRYWVANIDGRATNENFGPMTVPAESLFVLGDNRDESADSRVWGVVPRHAVRGRVLATWLSTDECLGTVDFTWQPVKEPSLVFSELLRQ